MSETEHLTQLEMVWPESRLESPPDVPPPSGYSLRTYRPGDEARSFEVMALAGWPDWDHERLAPWQMRILSHGWFMAVHQETDVIAATCMATRSNEYASGGELAWLAADPAHAGRGLGLAVAAAATSRFIAELCHPIHLYTEDYRLPALKTYLRLGYVPDLYASDQPDRWRMICEQLGWPFTPEDWPSRRRKERP